MTVGDKRHTLYGADYAGFLIGFTGGGIGGRRVVVHTTLGKCPVAVSGAHQKELELTLPQPVTDGGDMQAFKIGPAGEPRRAEQ
jgi:hypothetical protein